MMWQDTTLRTKMGPLIYEVLMIFTLNNNVVNRPIQALKEKLSETMIKKYNDYKCLAPFRRRQCHCCCYPAYQSCWLIIPLWWHRFYGLWNASQCFHNAIQLGCSIHHWAGESLLIGWRADCHSPAEEGQGFWRSGHSDYTKRKGGYEVHSLCSIMYGVILLEWQQGPALWHILIHI